ncbi:hypothetical protein SAMN05443572_104166 [Myxococcus fulvus]|uniref:Lipoprotein n=1 Tax=Myxococcus fulvus TaxID=33 RepID=A0A511SZ88_MYXFU|nr:hypothetical protein [Myxococcus fulvus]GEN07209.1 hypothetical protein MFU01_22460 [Myxococcus fulvus]SET97774.1 hypothetical protein SAMN05443572_104166 [Myxococcus fulvus]
MTPDITRRAPRFSRLGLYGVLALTFVALCWPTSAHAQAWTLTTEQRQAFLQYYAPVLLKRGNGDDGRHGYDWVTSFDFDRDGNFSNNKLNWKRIPQYVDASRAGPSAYDAWRIRPTLYTSLIEFMDGSKSLKLIYHVYHALDKNAAGDYQLHDWERVELLVTNVVGAPGNGESVAYAVVTQHKRNVVRRAGHVDLNFMQTATGKHLLVWQAEWSDKLAAAHGQELRFVTDPYAFFAGRMASAGKAEAGVNNDGGRKNVHYAFVPEGSADAVAAFGARALTYATADALASRYDNGKSISWPNVKRVTYELQDLADILPTHWQHGGYAAHWLDAGPIDFYLESALVNEGGATEVSAGMQRFFPKTRDVENDDDREGYIAKKWFVGTYEMNDSASDFGGGGSNAFHDNAYASTAVDSRGRTRASASGYTTSPSSFWWQHDYFVHAGFTDSTDGVEQGFWLPGAWYLPANGGFDGRWVQLFDDRPGLESGQR